jgi:hypothetical protein
MCTPSASAASVVGVGQAANAAASSAHSNVPASVDANVKVALVAAVGEPGPVTIVVSGGVRSVVQVAVARRRIGVARGGQSPRP